MALECPDCLSGSSAKSSWDVSHLPGAVHAQSWSRGRNLAHLLRSLDCTIPCGLRDNMFSSDKSTQVFLLLVMSPGAPHNVEEISRSQEYQQDVASCRRPQSAFHVNGTKKQYPLRRDTGKSHDGESPRVPHSALSI